MGTIQQANWRLPLILITISVLFIILLSATKPQTTQTQSLKQLKPIAVGSNFVVYKIIDGCNYVYVAVGNNSGVPITISTEHRVIYDKNNTSTKSDEVE